MQENIALNCDCMAFMRTVPDKAFDPVYYKLEEERFNAHAAQQNIFLMESE